MNITENVKLVKYYFQNDKNNLSSASVCLEKGFREKERKGDKERKREVHVSLTLSINL
jgi:hypothetical protein